MSTRQEVIFVINYSSILDQHVEDLIAEKDKVKQGSKIVMMPLVMDLSMIVGAKEVSIVSKRKGRIICLIDNSDCYLTQKVNSLYKIYQGKIKIISVTFTDRVESSVSNKVINVVSSHTSSEVADSMGMSHANTALRGTINAMVNYHHDFKMRESGIDGILYSMKKMNSVIIYHDLNLDKVSHQFSYDVRWDYKLASKMRTVFTPSLRIEFANSRRMMEIDLIKVNSIITDISKMYSSVDMAGKTPSIRDLNAIETVVYYIMLSYLIIYRKIRLSMRKIVGLEPSTKDASIPLRAMYAPLNMLTLYEWVMSKLEENPMTKVTEWLGNAIMKRAGASKIEVEMENKRLQSKNIVQQAAVRLEKANYDEVEQVIKNQAQRNRQTQRLKVKSIKLMVIIVISITNKKYAPVLLYTLYLIISMFLISFPYDMIIELMIMSSSYLQISILLSWAILVDVVPQRLNDIIYIAYLIISLSPIL